MSFGSKWSLVLEFILFMCIRNKCSLGRDILHLKCTLKFSKNLNRLKMPWCISFVLWHIRYWLNKPINWVHGNHHEIYLYNFGPLKPHFYPIKLGFTGIYIIFLISAQKHRLWVLVRTASTSTHNLCFEQLYKKYPIFYLKTFSFWWWNFQYIFE